MSRNKKNTNLLIEPAEKVFLHDDHKRPTTRREFLATGLIGFSGFMMAPSILSILTRPGNAFAAGGADCAAGAASLLPAFVAVNLSGGASLSSQYLPLDQGGNLLPKYDRIGLGNAPPVEMEFGNVPFAGMVNDRLTSQFLAGIRQATSPSTRNRTAFVGVCVQTQDDTGDNQIDPSGLVTAAGLTGSLLPRLGRSGTTTGIRQRHAKLPPPAPLVVRNVDDILGALSPAGSLNSRLNKKQKSSLMKLISGLSGSQAEAIRMPASSSGKTLANLIQCVTDKNIDLTSTDNPGVDPRQDSSVNVSSVWQMSTGGDQFGQSQGTRVALGTMVYNALKGNAGSVGIDLGGYDYHGSTRGTTDGRDNSAGNVVGRILESAAAMNRKVFIHVTTDGGVGTPVGSDLGANFTSDRGTGGMSYIIAFDPTRRPETTATQIGYFNSNQGAAEDTLVGSAERAGVAVFANYLKFAGQMGALERLLPGNYSTAELNQVLKFG